MNASVDEYAAHEILDRIENVRVILDVLLLSRDDLSDPVRALLEQAEEALCGAYQSQGSTHLD